MAYARALYPKAYLMPIYQVSRWAQPQPFDLLIFEFDHRPICVEVRSNQWGVNKPQTKTLSTLPGTIFKEIWLFKDGEQIPTIRRWDGRTWAGWESDETTLA